MMWEQLLRVTVNHGYLLQILVAELMFTRHLQRRSRFPLRLLLGGCCYAGASVLASNWIAFYTAGFNSLTIFLCSLCLCAFCFQEKFQDILFCCVGAQLTQNLAYNIENLIYQPFSHRLNLFGWLMLSLITYTVVYSVCYVLFARRWERRENVSLESGFVYAFSIAAALFVYAMQYLFQSYHIDTLWVTRPPLIFCCVAGLCVQYGLLALKNEQQEKAFLERFMMLGERQYEMMRSSMDVINRQAHDLKHQIALMRKLGQYDKDELAEIESAITLYESGSHTGNKALDVVLAEKQLLCHGSSIEFTMMVDGKALSFLQAADIASLFGNILDNAIEYERALEPPTCRCIALNVFMKGNFTCIRAENYCPIRPKLHHGLPLSSKSEHSAHGFGLRGVRYITEKYHGTMHIGFEGDLFVVSILLPKQKSL